MSQKRLNMNFRRCIILWDGTLSQKCTCIQGELRTHLPFTVEAENLMTYTRSPSGLDFMEMSEEIESGTPAAIIKLALRKDPQECRLASVYIP